MILSTKWKRLGWNLNKTEQSKILEINIVCVFWFGFLLLMETKKRLHWHQKILSLDL